MAYLGVGVIAVGLLYLLGRAYTSVDAGALVRFLRYIVGGGLIAFGVVLSIAGRGGCGLFLVAMGVSAIATGRIGPIDLGSTRRTAGSVSRVRTAWFEMRLDHDSGDMAGEVLQGIHVGKSLDDISDDDLIRMYEMVAVDPDSAALLEAYLDRRIAGWRDDVEGDAAAGAGAGGASDATGPMTNQQAYEILGLAPGASQADIRAAHRRLMKKVHPDQGGSTFLAAKINEAKDLLIGRRR
jgi:hypothetical protein